MYKIRLEGRYENYGTKDAYDSNSSVYGITDDYVMKEEYKKIERNKKVAMMIEPRVFMPEAYKYLERHYTEYKYVFTYDDELLKLLPNARKIVYGTYWCSSDEEKSKGISMICSNKEYLEGHRKRKEIAAILDKGGKVDVMGAFKDGKYVEPIKALKEYKFSVAMENERGDYYFTEKLCNCLANKVVPIYYGARKLDEYFDINGIICVDNRDEIPEIINNLDVDKEYEKRKEAIDRNYELVKEYRSFDDWFYKRYEKEIDEMFENNKKER